MLCQRNVQVNGLERFEWAKLKDAILSYLCGIWSGFGSATRRPEIRFGSLTLRLDTDKEEYYAYGVSDDEDASGADVGEKLHVAGGRQNDVEIALARFVKNDQIRALMLYLPKSDGSLMLWKKPQRGQYGCIGTNLPQGWDENGPVRWIIED